MISALHSVSVNHCNVVTQARIAKETGYQSLEFLYDKLLRYVDNGGSLPELRKLIAGYGLTTSVFNGLVGIGQYGADRVEMLDRARYYTQICSELECPTMQILTQHCLDDLPKEARMEILTENIGRLPGSGSLTASATALRSSATQRSIHWHRLWKSFGESMRPIWVLSLISGTCMAPESKRQKMWQSWIPL